MYAEDMPPIRDAMRHDMEVFRRGAMFAVLSIRQKIVIIPDQMGALFDPEDESQESPLFGHKWQAWEYISDNSKCARLWANIKDCIPVSGAYPLPYQTRDALRWIVEVPGIGIVKGAFILQLMGFDIACLDGRNAARLKRNNRQYETSAAIKARPARMATLTDHYVKEFYGRAAQFWDDWCKDVGKAYDMEPDVVSKLHLAIIPPNYVPF